MAGIFNQINNALDKAGDIATDVNDTINDVTGGIFKLGGRQTGPNYFEEWRAQLDSVPRVNRYLCQITVPNNLLEQIIVIGGESMRADLRRLSLFVETASFPGKNIRTVANETVYGPSYEVAQGLTYAEEIAMTFFMRNDHGERLFFNAWQDLIIDPQTYNLNYYKEYVGQMDVYQLDENNNKTAGIRIKEVFPKGVNPLEFNVSTPNEFHRASVSLAFKEWVPLQIVDGEGREFTNYVEQRMDTQRIVRRKSLFEDVSSAVNKAIGIRNQVVGASQKVTALKNFFKNAGRNPVSNLGIGKFF